MWHQGILQLETSGLTILVRFNTAVDFRLSSVWRVDSIIISLAYPSLVSRIESHPPPNRLRSLSPTVLLPLASLPIITHRL